MTTALRDAGLQSQVRVHTWPFRVEVRFWEDISLELSGHQDLLVKHYPAWNLHKVGTKEIVELLFSSEPEDYQYDDHTGVFLYREDVKLQIILDR